MITKFESYGEYSTEDEPDFGDVIIKKNDDILVSLEINNDLTESMIVFDIDMIDTYLMEKREIKEFYSIEEYYRKHPEIYDVIPLTTDNSRLQRREATLKKLREVWISKVPDFKVLMTTNKYNI